jgi:hypothetical protein
MTRRWLAEYDWEFVTAANAMLCKASGALHKATGEGHAPAQQLWDENHRLAMPLEEAIALCRKCHRLAPFCNFNGNTFAAVARNLVSVLKLSPDQAYLARSWIGHIVAGVATPEEMRAFEQFASSLEKHNS